MIEKLTAGMKSWIKQDHQDICESPAEYDFPLTALGSEENPEHFRYDFVLDNHCIYPEECEIVTRVGTVFYMLELNDDGNLVDEKVPNLLTSMGKIRNRLSTAWKWQSTRPVSSRTIGNISS